MEAKRRSLEGVSCWCGTSTLPTHPTPHDLNPPISPPCKTCYARIMDSKRRFLEAASRYYELSSLSGRTIGGAAVSEDDVTSALRGAITCTVLAAVGGIARGPHSGGGLA